MCEKKKKFKKTEHEFNENGVFIKRNRKWKQQHLKMD